MEDGKPEQSGPASGWYPDPSGDETRERYWDGDRWTDLTRARWQVEQQPADGPKETSSHAIVSLVLGILLVTGPAAIVFALIARRKIAEGKGRISGGGLATAGLVLGVIGTLLTTIALIVAATGGLESTNEESASGEEVAIARVVDDLEEAFGDDEGLRACRELLTKRFADLLGDGTEAGCADFLDDAVGGNEFQVDIEIQRYDVRGDRATIAVEEGGDAQRWRLVRAGGDWRVDDITDVPG